MTLLRDVQYLSHVHRYRENAGKQT